MDTLLCASDTPKMCEQYRAWMAAEGCASKQAALVTMKAAFKGGQEDSGNLRFGIARVQMATEDLCKQAPAADAPVAHDGGPR